MKDNQNRVVIIGAGFAGLWAARTFSRMPVQVTLIDRNNYHLFLPLLYQVSSAEIEPEDIAYPIRSILRKCPNVSFDLAQVREIDCSTKEVICEDHRVSYDYLLLATGSTTGFFNTTGAEAHSFPLKTMAEGIRLRNHILCRFEHAAHEPDMQILQRRLTFVVVGGGPTGVEFAGALAELVRGPLEKDFPEVCSRNVRIVLVESRDHLIQMFPQKLKDYARERLRRLGVEVLLNSMVSEVGPASIQLSDGTVIPSETVVWTAGVQGEFFSASGCFPMIKGNRIKVLDTLQVEGFPSIYAAGDLSFLPDKNDSLPMIAPVAISEGIHAAKNILRHVGRQEPLPFVYKDKGAMVTIGRNSGVASLGKIKVSGFFAWIAWIFVHLVKLIGFRNRLLVMINWAWDYFFYERSVRLILSDSEEKQEC